MPVDMSESTAAALEDAVVMRERWNATIDVFYVWTGAPAVDSEAPDRALRELEAFAGDGGEAWDTLDRLGALEQCRVLAIRGYLTPNHDGHTITSIAADGGYDLVLLGTRSSTFTTECFDLHRPGSGLVHKPQAPTRPVVTMPSNAPVARRVAAWPPLSLARRT